MRQALILGVLGALTAGTAAAQQQQNPSWTKPADPNLAMALAPDFAAFLDRPGWALITCLIVRDGHPFQCYVVDESPNGLGFGSAARLVVASAEVQAARRDGEIVPRSVRTTVRFLGPAGQTQTPSLSGVWMAPEPSEARLTLAGRLVDQNLSIPPDFHPFETLLNGLDYDRREVVLAWLHELTPLNEARIRQARTLQFARLFDEQALERLLRRETVQYPAQEVFEAAYPEPTPEESAALEELKRRYCARYDCEMAPPPGADRPATPN